MAAFVTRLQARRSANFHAHQILTSPAAGTYDKQIRTSRWQLPCPIVRVHTFRRAFECAAIEPWSFGGRHNFPGWPINLEDNIVFTAISLGHGHSLTAPCAYGEAVALAARQAATELRAGGATGKVYWRGTLAVSHSGSGSAYQKSGGSCS